MFKEVKLHLFENEPPLKVLSTNLLVTPKKLEIEGALSTIFFIKTPR